MADVDAVAAALNELQDMKAVLGFNDGRHLARFECESRSLKLADHLATTEETQFAALGCGAGVFRVQFGKHGEPLAFEDALAQLGKLATHAVALSF